MSSQQGSKIQGPSHTHKQINLQTHKDLARLHAYTGFEDMFAQYQGND